MNLSREAAWNLLTEWTESESLRKHALAVEAAVRGYARQQGANEEEWGVVALLHESGATREASINRFNEAPEGMATPTVAECLATRSEAETLKLLDSFADAWNRHDLDALMSMMTDDCVFEASAGPEVDGQRSEGLQAVRAAYAAVFETFRDAHWANPRHFVAGNRAVSEWTFTGTQRDGRRVEVNGCDLLTLRGGKIAVKNSYRKNRPAGRAGPDPARPLT